MSLEFVELIELVAWAVGIIELCVWNYLHSAFIFLYYLLSLRSMRHRDPSAYRWVSHFDCLAARCPRAPPAKMRVDVVDAGSNVLMVVVGVGRC